MQADKCMEHEQGADLVIGREWTVAGRAFLPLACSSVRLSSGQCVRLAICSVQWAACNGHCAMFVERPLDCRRQAPGTSNKWRQPFVLAGRAKVEKVTPFSSSGRPRQRLSRGGGGRSGKGSGGGGESGG